MAEFENSSSSTSSSTSSNFNTVVSLLRQAETLLQSSVHPGGNQSSTEANESSSTSTENRSLANFRSLFTRYRTALPSPSLGQARPSAGPPTKRKRGNGGFVVKETWTHDFICLANHCQSHVPSRSEKFQLQDAGLGRKTIVFHRKDQPLAFAEKVESVYPKLKDAGGFELLRSGPSNKDLVVITPPASGYSVAFLRESSGLGQALAYIRPLQKSLSMAVAKNVFKEQPGTSTQCPKVKCIACLLELPVTEVRQHQLVCPQLLPTESLTPPAPCVELEECCGHQTGDQRPDTGYTAECTETTSIESSLSPNHETVAQLQSLFPERDEDAIRDVLGVCKGNVSLAASRLINWDGNQEGSSSRAVDNTIDEDEEDLMKSPFLMNDLTDSDENLQSIMAKHRRQLESEECNRMTVERESLWEDCVVFFKQHKFNPKFSLRVKFSGEAGLDAGGLHREFGSVLIKKMFSSDAKLFEGDDERKVPIYNADAVHSNLFFLAGKICAYLLSHLDIGVSCLSPVVYSYISTGEVHEASKECTVEDVPDYDVRRSIQEVNKSSSCEDLQRVLGENDQTDALLAAGWVRVLTLENKGLAMWQLIVHEVLLKRKVALDQFSAGLKVLGVHELLMHHSKVMEPYFVAKEQTLSAKAVFGLFDDISKQQSDGKKEQARQFLIKAITDLDVEGSKTDLHHFLQFLTGLDRIPPLGLETFLTITYKEDQSKTMHAETCAYNLSVPTVHASYEEFKQYFLLACREAYIGFGLV